MSGDYGARVRAVEDATRLMLAMVRPETADRGPTYSTLPQPRPTLDRFDVLEVARFLLDEDVPDAPAECGSCGYAHAPGQAIPAMQCEARR